jgi:DEAD/DEAH box helicase domain-containing protein
VTAHSTTAQKLRAIVEAWRETLPGELAAEATSAGRDAVFAPWPADLDPRAVAGLARLGVAAPYAHQVESFERLSRGEDIVVATPTASGKSLCTHLPVIDRLLRDPAARALYLFPTKALARDQEASLARLLAAVGSPVRLAVYDGDTPDDARRAAKREARVLITNPDMLHTGILPHHASFAPFFAGLSHVVVDELHQYRGVFGSHVANVIRRLRRVAAFHGAEPRFAACSATIGNPGELAAAVLGASASTISESGAPAGPRTIIIYNPELVGPALGVRRSALKVASRLAAELVDAGVTVLVFCQTRRGVEVTLRYLRARLQAAGRSPDRVRGYRGGYLPELRREIETALRDGALDAVVATNALELGIDVGGLDAVVMAGYPGTIAATQQRAGRAGRRCDPSLAVLVARSEPLDQFLAREPSFLLDASPERALVQPDNVEILLPHLACAAFELPFAPQERFGALCAEDTAAALDCLAAEGTLAEVRGAYHFVGASYPAAAVSLRSVGGRHVVAVDAGTGAPVAEVEPRTARRELHERAVYQHEGATYLVARLDLEAGRAELKLASPPYYTVAVETARLRVDERLKHRALGGGSAAFAGDVTVREEISAFKKIRFETHENLGVDEVSLPPSEMETEALWITPGGRAEEALGPGLLAHGLAGIGSALHHVAALRLMCDPRDLATAVQAAPDEDGDGGGRLALYLYDAHAGGVGLSDRAFDEIDGLLDDAARLVGGCPCADGCPSCVGPAGEMDAPVKRVAEVLLVALRSDFGGNA